MNGLMGQILFILVSEGTDSFVSEVSESVAEKCMHSHVLHAANTSERMCMSVKNRGIYGCQGVRGIVGIGSGKETDFVFCAILYLFSLVLCWEILPLKKLTALERVIQVSKVSRKSRVRNTNKETQTFSSGFRSPRQQQSQDNVRNSKLERMEFCTVCIGVKKIKQMGMNHDEVFI